MSKEREALKALIHEMEYVLSCINAEEIPFDGDDFHEALRLGKQALDHLAQQCVCGDPNSAGEHRTDGPCLAPQPEQEPVAKNEKGRITWLVDDWPQNCFLYAEPPKWTPVEIGVDVTSEGAHVVAMYLLPDAVRYVFYSQFHTAPQRTWEKPWVWLTDEEIGAILEDPTIAEKHQGNWLVLPYSYARAVEAKLKEKNT